MSLPEKSYSKQETKIWLKKLFDFFKLNFKYSELFAVRFKYRMILAIKGKSEVRSIFTVKQPI